MERKDYYVPQKIKNELIEIYQNKEIAILIGMPSSGKTRLVKSVVYGLDIEDKYSYIDLTQFQNEEYDSVKFINTLKTDYDNNKNLFFFENLNLDHKSTVEILNLIKNYSQSLLNPICIILSLTCLPNIYKETFGLNKILFQNNIVIDRQDPVLIEDNFENLIQRFSYKLTDAEKAKIVRLSGNIPTVVKQMIKDLSQNNDIDDFTHYEMSLNNILDQLSLKELLGLKQINKNHKVDRFVLESLQQTGLVVGDSIKSEYLKKQLGNYSRGYIPYVFNNKVFVNEINITSYFTLKELNLLSSLKQNKIVSREAIYYIFSGKENLDEYSDTSVEKFIARLRSKFEIFGISNKYIKTSKRKGYSL